MHITIAELMQVITAFSALGAVILSFLNRGKIQQVRLSLNSRLSQLLVETRAAAHMEGKEAERIEEKERKNGNYTDGDQTHN